MQLTRRTDYALRLLIYLTGIGERRVQIAEVAHSQNISRTHLMKIVNDLAHAGFVDTVRGRGGGIRLGRDPADINLRELVQTTEPGCPLLDCTACRLINLCNLPGILDKASSAFNAVLAEYTLADIVREQADMPYSTSAGPPQTGAMSE
ncbi:MAG: Rrf2 family transcriptional regulator [Sphingomonadaceae bacterium]|nr:Rrf2 family transcriptional regulator [Sphingomonadaceae bacterium]